MECVNTHTCIYSIPCTGTLFCRLWKASLVLFIFTLWTRSYGKRIYCGPSRFWTSITQCWGNRRPRGPAVHWPRSPIPQPDLLQYVPHPTTQRKGVIYRILQTIVIHQTQWMKTVFMWKWLENVKKLMTPVTGVVPKITQVLHVQTPTQTASGAQRMRERPRESPSIISEWGSGLLTGYKNKLLLFLIVFCLTGTNNFTACITMSQFPINKQQYCTSKRNLFKTDKLSRFGIEHTNSDTMKKKWHKFNLSYKGWRCIQQFNVYVKREKNVVPVKFIKISFNEYV